VARDEFDIMLTDITQPDLYDLRDKCANQKWPRFADQMISALSSMFRQREARPFDRDEDQSLPGHGQGPRSRSERQPRVVPREWPVAFQRAPLEIKIH